MRFKYFFFLLGGGIVSIFNFYIYTILASGDTSGDFAPFIEATLFSNFYLFCFPGSTSIVFFGLESERNKSRYVVSYLIVSAIFFFILSYLAYLSLPFIYVLLCFASALAAHFSAYLAFQLTCQTRLLSLKLSSIVGPISFLISYFILNNFNFLELNTWIISYFVSYLFTLVALVFFCKLSLQSFINFCRQIPLFSGAFWRRSKFLAFPSKRLLLRIFIPSLLGLFSQLDLSLALHFRNILDITAYSISHKLVVSLSGLFGASLAAILFNRYRSIKFLLKSPIFYLLPFGCVFAYFVFIKISSLFDSLWINEEFFNIFIPLAMAFSVISIVLNFFVSTLNPLNVVKSGFVSLFPYLASVFILKSNDSGMYFMFPLFVLYFSNSLSLLLFQSSVNNVKN